MHIQNKAVRTRRTGKITDRNLSTVAHLNDCLLKEVLASASVSYMQTQGDNTYLPLSCGTRADLNNLAGNGSLALPVVFQI